MTFPTGRRPILAVSPHLDDAVMAAGATLGAMADAGHAVTVCTVFAGSQSLRSLGLRPPFMPTADSALMPSNAGRTKTSALWPSLAPRPSTCRIWT
jgi:GlcNAc-PI de-N-acetylase